MKQVYCASCGMCLIVTRRALPKYAKIIDTVEYHECLPVPLDLDLTPADIHPIPSPGEDKFVEKINKLCSDDLRDRRQEQHIRADSSAPANVLDHFKRMKED